MKFALVGSALVFAATTLAAGPTGYGDDQQHSPQNEGGIASPVGQGNNNGVPAPPAFGEHQNGPQQGRPQRGSGQPNQNRGSMASPVGQDQNRRPKPAGYGQQENSPQRGHPQNSPQQGHPQGPPQPNQNGGGIASPVGQGQDGHPAPAGYGQGQKQPTNGGQGHPDGNRGPAIASPVGGSDQNGGGSPMPYDKDQKWPGSNNQGQGHPDGNHGPGFASPFGGSGQGQHGGSSTPYGKDQKAPGSGHPDNNRGPAMVSPKQGSGRGQNGGGYGQQQKSPGGSQGHPNGNHGPAMTSPVGGNGHNMSGPQCCIESSSSSHPLAPGEWGMQRAAEDERGQHQQAPHQQGQGQPSGIQSGMGQMPQCITPQEGQDWLDKFISVLGKTGSNIEQTANSIIADQFIEVSNSIFSLQRKPLSSEESVAAPTKQAWVQGVTRAPAPQGIQTKDVVFGCDKLVWYWSFDKVGAGKYQQNGFNLFHFVRNGDKLQADRLDLEFDTIAWGLNTGRLSEVENSDGEEVEGAQEDPSSAPLGGGEQTRA